MALTFRPGSSLVAACLPVLFLMSDRLSAQIPLGGALSGTLAPGVYHTTSSISVAQNQALTLPAGVIVKFTAHGHEFTVDGTLLVNGTAGNPVIFTDIADDSAGGNTNGGGVSTGTTGNWRGLVFNATAGASALSHADVRFGGGNFVSNVELVGCNPTFTNCTVRNCFTHGMDLNGASRPTVANCTFADNGGSAIESAPITALPGFSGNTATGNNGGNFARVTVGAIAGNLTIGPAAMITGAIVLDATATVAPGAVLTLQAGLVVKFRTSRELTVDGTLLVNGIAGNPVIFTDIADDSAGGNTNGGGVSTGTTGNWRGLVFNATAGASALSHADVRFGGGNFVSNVELVGCNPTFTNCTVRNCFTHGMDLNGASRPTVANCTFADNGGSAIESAPITALPGFSGNTATGNNGGNFARVTVGAIAGNLTIGPAAMITGAIVLDATATVAPGAVLTLQAGLVVKFRTSRELTVDGTLLVNGIAGNPVIFTDIADDSAGGNTNGGGASTGTTGNWRGLVFNATAGASALSHADVRFGGGNFVSNFELVGCNATFTDCIVRNCFTHGMDLNGTSRPNVTNCTFTNNGGTAVESVPIAAVPGFTNNTASGNNGANFVRITNGTVTGALRIGPQCVMNGGLVLADDLTVAPAGALTLEQGVIFKSLSSRQVAVDGTIDVLGTAFEPVVFTALADDEHGGDTDGNGPTTGSSGAWRGIVCNAGAGASRFENVLIRFTGGFHAPGLASSSSNVSLRAVRVDRAFQHGFVLDALAGDAQDLIAWNCGGNGIHLTNGGFHVLHATCTGNSTGIRRETGWIGSVINSISHGNTANFGNFGAGAQVIASNGFVGGSGNLNVNPLFVDATTGNLHLQPFSPCLGAANAAFAFLALKDFDENSRVLDHALTGAALPDMGAFELPAWTIAVTGAPRPGSGLQFTVNGPVGISVWVFGFLDGSLPILPYGILLAGLPGPGLFVMSSFLPVGATQSLAIPNDPGFVGLTGGIQSLTVPVGNIGLGNVTQLYRLLVRP